jgi:uncharacterized protein (DUF2267 family)
MRRVNLKTLNIRLRGYPRETAERLAADLPKAIAHALDYPNEAPKGLVGDIARQVVAGLEEGDA